MVIAAMPRKKRIDTSVKVDAEVIKKARMISAFRDISMAEYLSTILKPIVDKEFEGFRKALTRGDNREAQAQ